MTSALDTNIISGIWLEEPGWQTLVERVFARSRISALTICPAVYMELHAHPAFSRALMLRFFDHARIRILPMTLAMWTLAGERYAAYVKRRRSGEVAMQRRMLGDFIIGAHATLSADVLLTNDLRLYRTHFPELQLV